MSWYGDIRTKSTVGLRGTPTNQGLRMCFKQYWFQERWDGRSWAWNLQRTVKVKESFCAVQSVHAMPSQITYNDMYEPSVS